MKHQSSKILLLIVITIFISACNAVKRVGDNEHLLTKTTLFVNDEKEESENINNLLYQKANTKLPLVKTPLRLHIYNLARPNIDSTLKARALKNPKRNNRWRKFLSKKQLNKYYQSRINFNNKIKKNGEAPVIINDTLSKKTVKRLKSYYYNYGWFDVQASHETIRNNNKRGNVTYRVTTGNPYVIDSISTNIATPIIDSLYKVNEKESLIKLNEQYKSINYINERDRITNYMRNSGVYHFSQENVYFQNDTIGKTKTINLELQISDRQIRLDDTLMVAPFKIYKNKAVNIYTDSGYENRNKNITDSTTYNGINIYSKGKLRYNPKTITDVVFMKPNTIFKDKNRPLTSRRISNLRTFKYPKIEYVENEIDTTLTTNIYLTPLKRFSLGFSAEASQSNIQSIGFALNPSLLMRNVFKGAETLEISAITAIGASEDAGISRDQFFDINEFGGDIKLTIPRLFSPFNTEKIIPSEMFPSTRISLAATSQTNIGLDKQTFTGAYNYQWYPNKQVTNRLDLFNVQYVNNLNIANYFKTYEASFNSLNTIAINSGYINAGQTLGIPTQANQFISDAISGNLGASISENDLLTVNAIEERKDRLTEDNLILSTNFNYIKDKRDDLFDNHFSILRLRLELAGNLLSTASNLLGLQKNTDNNYEIFNVVFSQYVKTEVDYVKYWDFGNKNVLAVRSYFGIAIPYGNATSIPFAKSFFAGGSNDNRAWSAYNLGPGSSQSTNEFNEANMKIALSAENRFNLFGALNGALFIDAGNIWNVLDEVNDKEATFKSFSDLKNIAIGSGFGLRYDFDFFILRGDIGFKTYDPSYGENNRWFNDYNFANAVYNIGINYPF